VKTSVLAIAFATILALLSSAGGAAGSSPPPAGDDVASMRVLLIEEALEMGDEAYLESLAPSVDELAAASLRISTRERAHVVYRQVRDRSDFGGLWHDGTEVHLLTKEPDALASLYPDVTVHEATYTYAELLGFQAAIRASLSERSVPFVIALRERENKLEIRIPPGESLDLGSIPLDAVYLGEWDGPVLPATSAPDTDHAAADRMAGLRFQLANASGAQSVGVCTWGFSGTRDIGSPPVTKYYFITAGHCIPLDNDLDDDKLTDTVDVWQSNLSGNKISNDSNAYVRSTSWVDAVRIADANDPDTIRYHGPFEDNEWQVHSVYYVKDGNDELVGDPVCASLGNSGEYACAELLDKNVDVTITYSDLDPDWSDREIIAMREWDHETIGGDSGSGMKHNFTGIGVLLTQGDTGFYIRLDRVLDKLGIELTQ